jgi:hypothetical protein
MSERVHPEMQDLEGVEALAMLVHLSDLLLAIYKAADGPDRRRLVSLVERLLSIRVEPFVEQYLPEARDLPASQRRPALWFQWMVETYPEPPESEDSM